MPNSSRTGSGEGEPYSEPDEAAIEKAIQEAEDEYATEYGEEPTGFGEDSPVPETLTVTAEVEWNGSVQNSNGGKRTVRLDLGADRIEKLGPRIKEARAAGQKAAQARPARSYRAKGWQAQLRELTKSARGSTLADNAGLAPLQRTLLSWLSGDRPPSKANQAKIGQAYQGLSTWRVDNAQQGVREANHRLTEELTEQTRDRFGSTVRFRDIDEMRFDD
ncbi:MAG: hypothetical protein L0I76_08425 [Pseudonocardia sp.]|nr:hypothetical protein [Pseudonocardia sp.]